MKPLLLAAIVLALAAPADAALYRWVDKSGVTYYTSEREAIPEPYRASAQKLDAPTPRTPE
ncbi:MAG TPA: DUF4124 domain-containing protein, partial [Methylomirabilota bacterium]|nr:DUF4124 domain-containing protein [Methylomirabilota bacterium]